MWSLFKDKNEINEKNIVGFASFVVMCLFAVADWVTLGCFGISSFEKVKNK
jgi:hypothetical protein